MGKRLPYTPKSQITTALRRMWLRSRERATALRREKYCCESCGIKQSKAKGREVQVEVHHRHGAIDWDEIVSEIRLWLLVDPEDLEVLCPECHNKRHRKAPDSPKFEI